MLLRFFCAFYALRDAKYSVHQSHRCYMAFCWCYKSESESGGIWETISLILDSFLFLAAH